LDEFNIHSPGVLKKQESVVLSADDMAASAITNIGLHRAINCIQEFYKEVNMKINVEKNR
jgi:hypothetical protein